jgi:UMF1 family MFS transporter
MENGGTEILDTPSHEGSSIKGNKRIIKGWIFYDWANSVYNLVISTAIFPIFYSNVTERHYLAKMGRDELAEGEKVMVDFFGFELFSNELISYVLSASFLMVSLLSPMLSGIADYTGNKKRFMQFFCYLGALACTSLYWFDPNYIEIGLLSIFLASIGFWNSFVFYNAYLPEIAEPKDHDNISARGFSMGYFGSMILLILCLVMITFAGPQYTTLSFIFVGIWWIGFAQITFSRLPNNVHNRKPEKGYILLGFKELIKVYKVFRQTKRLKRYLRAFFFFNTGVQTVMLMAVYFAKKAIVWDGEDDDSGLIISIILIQLLGAAGAYSMSHLSGRIGNLKTLRIVGQGDPSLTTAALQNLAQQLKSQGIKQIDQLIVSESNFEKPAINPTWEWSDLYHYYDVAVNSLILYENTFQLQIIPQQPGQPGTQHGQLNYHPRKAHRDNQDCAQVQGQRQAPGDSSKSIRKCWPHPCRIFQLPQTSADQEIADVRLPVVCRLPRHMAPRKAYRLACHLLLAQPTPPGNAFDDMPIPVARPKVHLAVDPGRITEQHLFNNAQ